MQIMTLIRKIKVGNKQFWIQHVTFLETSSRQIGKFNGQKWSETSLQNNF